MGNLCDQTSDRRGTRSVMKVYGHSSWRVWIFSKKTWMHYTVSLSSLTPVSLLQPRDFMCARSLMPRHRITVMIATFKRW